MVTIEFQILGSPKFIRNGRSARLHSAKATALLAYLVCQPDVAFSRDHLATLFWGEFTDAKARQSLRQVLYSLRRACKELAEDCLVVDSKTAVFHPHPHFQVDSLNFAQYISSENWQAASQLYRGSLLDGIALDDCPAFEEWLFLTRDHTLQQMIRTRQAWVDELLATGQADEAIKQGQQLVQLDLLNEGAYRRLMRAYALHGDPDGMGHVYRQCCAVLERELGVEPAEKTAVLYDQLRSATILPPRPLAPSLSTPAVAFPYQGRQGELGELTHLFDQSLAGQASLVFVSGEAGSGKSELVYEFCRRLEQEGKRPFSLFAGHAFEAELGAPYTMWADVLTSLNAPDWQQPLAELPTVWRQQLARLVPALGFTLAAGLNTSPAENQLRFMQGVVQSLIHLAQPAPLILFFDNLQWADARSLELLHYAARQCRSQPIFFVAAFRGDSLRTNLQSFFSQTSYPIIKMTPHTQADVATLLSQLDLPQSAALAPRLHQHCQGNWLMLLETVRLLQESSRWNGLLAADTALPIPPRIHDLIATRLGQLNDSQRRVLAAAAVVERPFDLTLLRHVSGQPELELLENVEALIDHAFLEEREGPRHEQILFHHDFERQVTYENLRQSQRRALHRRTADALLTMHQSHPSRVVEEVAFHYEQAGDERALTYLQRAAEQAEAFFALPQATALLSRALAFQERFLEEEPNGRFDLLLAREKLLAQQGQRAEQAKDIALLIELAEQIADPQRQAQIWIRQASYLSDRQQRAASQEAAETALSLYRATQDRQGEAQVLRELGFLYWSIQDFSLAIDYGRQALRLCRQLGDVDGEATALHNLAEIHRSLNSPRQAITFYEQAMQLQWARREKVRQSWSLYGLAHALRQLGQPEAAIAKYQQALDQIDAQAGDKIMASRIHHEMAMLFTELGELEQAIGMMQQAVRTSREVGYASGLAHSLIGLSYLLAQLQQLDEARTALVEALEWLRLLEDETSIEVVNGRLQQLTNGTAPIEEPPAQMGWVKSYVTLVEGKVYCEFESPLARMT